MGVGGDDGGLHAVSARQVLGSDDGNFCWGFGVAFGFGVRFDEDDLRMVVGEIGVLDDSGEERPESEGFVGGFEIENEVDFIHFARFFDEEEASEKLLRNREGCLPDGGLADLLKHPLDDIRDLQRVGKVRLQGSVGERAQVGFDG